jgi:hypothetical protein
MDVQRSSTGWRSMVEERRTALSTCPTSGDLPSCVLSKSSLVCKILDTIHT